MMPGGGMHGGYSVMRSMRRDSSVSKRQLRAGIARRVIAFAKPYRTELLLFLVMIVFDALIGVATPVLAGRVVNQITAHGEVRVVVWIAIVIAGLAVVDAGLSLAQRWYSSRIGEGLIFDLRTGVFDHIQRMPLAFFTRTQTGALVSRLNSDVLGAQQAFTSTLSGLVSNVVSLAFTAAVMFTLSWQITALALVLLPVFVLPAKRVGATLQVITRESYSLNASMNATMTERFNVSGALLVKLFGKPEEESASFSSRAARVRDIGVRSAMYGRTLFAALSLVASLAQALVYGLGGYYALTGQLSAGTVVDPGAAAVAAVRAADAAVQRPGGRDERAGQLRPGLRGARPAAADRRRAGRGADRPARRRPSSSTTCGSPTRPPPRCRWPRWRTSRCWTRRPARTCCAASASPPRPAR